MKCGDTPLRRLVSVLSIAAVVVTMLLTTVPMFSYVNLYTKGSGGAQTDHWDFTAFPVAWQIHPVTGTNISGNQPVAAVISTSFVTWVAAPNAALTITQGADTNVGSAGFDGTNVVCFTCTDTAFTDDSALAVTLVTTADAAGQDTKHGQLARFIGQIIDADIVFNPNVKYTTGGTPGEDLQTIATHEIGHFFGLDHSGVVRAVMFPFAPDTPLQTLSYDDVAAISSLYPKNVQDVQNGAIAGTVRFASGGPVFGAHVYASSNTNAEPFAGNIRKTPIASITLPDGTYTIHGVPIDTYTVVAEPLDQPMTNNEIPDFGSAFGRGAVQTNFNTRWH